MDEGGFADALGTENDDFGFEGGHGFSRRVMEREAKTQEGWRW